MPKAFLITIMSIVWCLSLFAPPNCELLKHDEDCYKGCNKAWEAIRYKQGSKQSQEYFDLAIKACPSLDYAYKEKAVPYLKRGLFAEWKIMIDKAVTLAPEKHLGYRASCMFQFLKDYRSTLEDIHSYRKLVGSIGYCQNGDYHLDVVEFLCYKQLGMVDSARSCMNKFLAKKKDLLGLYDYYHFGVFEFEQGKIDEAKQYFELQIETNDYLAETYYYLAKCELASNNKSKAKNYHEQAGGYYRRGRFRKDTYAEPLDKVYLIQIELLEL
jgi:tetratricopeptide (TPR) repeat protein